MSGWSIFAHDDLPPLPTAPVPPPLDERLPDGEVAIRPEERVSDFDARRIERQAKLAHAIRSVAGEVEGKRRQMLIDRALLIEVATSVGEVLELLEEVEALGVKVERRAA